MNAENRPLRETLPLLEASETWAALAAVHKRYGKTVALDGLDLAVRPGEMLAVLGPNGAGKSTAIALLLGLTQPDGGEVRLFGGSPRDLERRQQVGVMMQEVFLPPELQVREQIDLVRSYYPAPLETAAVLQMTATATLARRPYGKLSGGQKRQVQFALAVCGQPRLLFLDEPTVGLDIAAREAMWATLRRLVGEGCSIVLTTHYLEEAEALADRVVVMARGRAVAAGSVAEIRALVGRRQIACRTTVRADEVAAWPEVESVATDRERLRIHARDAEAVVRRLLAVDLDLADLEVTRAGLAEAFAEITAAATVAGDPAAAPPGGAADGASSLPLEAA